MTCVTLIGFGEAASTFAAAGGWGEKVRAFDIDPARKTAMKDAGTIACSDVTSALSGSRIICSLVTADQAVAAAQSCADLTDRDAIWIDMNSVAPQTKRIAASYLETNGVEYVDAAILAPVHPAQLNVPILVSGATADAARNALISLGFANVQVVGDQIGMASAIKLIRSVMVKGIEALTDEMMAAAQVAGVADHVLASLDASEKHDSWFDKASYNLERMETHGARRAAEMEEAVRMLRSLGVDPVMTEGTVHRQREAADRKTEKDAA